MENLESLYEILIKSYSNENLNQITGKIIGLYESKNFDRLYGLTNKISEFISIDSDKSSKCFSRLIMLYHPDRGEYYRRQISRLREENNVEELEKYSHILILGDLEEPVLSMFDEDLGYDPEYEWDNSQSGYSYFTESGNGEDEMPEPEPAFVHSFFNIVKLRMYGTLDIELPAHYLEDFEDVEFAESHIESLDGIEHCKHVTELDLSGNNISDISDLWNLEMLEELYLADNQIGIIDSMTNLKNLRIIDISGNEIDDISPIFELSKLEFVNIIGNYIPPEQIKRIEGNGVLIMH